MTVNCVGVFSGWIATWRYLCHMLSRYVTYFKAIPILLLLLLLLLLLYYMYHYYYYGRAIIPPVKCNFSICILEMKVKVYVPTGID